MLNMSIYEVMLDLSIRLSRAISGPRYRLLGPLVVGHPEIPMLP
jgi:hypothetical protein